MESEAGFRSGAGGDLRSGARLPEEGRRIRRLSDSDRSGEKRPEGKSSRLKISEFGAADKRKTGGSAPGRLSPDAKTGAKGEMPNDRKEEKRLWNSPSDL